MPTQRQQARKFLAKRGIARLNELRAAGVTAATVTRMERDGEIARLAKDLDDVEGIGFDQNQVRRLDRDVGPHAHRHPELG